MKTYFEKFRRNSVVALASLGIACTGATAQGLSFGSVNTLWHTIKCGMKGALGMGMLANAEQLGKGMAVEIGKYMGTRGTTITETDLNNLKDLGENIVDVGGIIAIAGSIVEGSRAVQSARNNDVYEKVKKLEENQKNLARRPMIYTMRTYNPGMPANLNTTQSFIPNSVN